MSSPPECRVGICGIRAALERKTSIVQLTIERRSDKEYSNLLKHFTLHSGYSRPKSSNTLSCIVPCNAVYLPCIALLVLKVRKVEAIRAVGVQLQETRCDDVVFQVHSLASDVSFSSQDKPSLVGNDEVVVDKLAIEDVATVCEQSEPARHCLCGMPIPWITVAGSMRDGCESRDPSVPCGSRRRGPIG